MRKSLFVKRCIVVMTGAIICLGLVFSSTMAQAQTGCTYTISPSPLTLPHHLAYTRGFSITTNKTDCSWTVEETADWISFASSSQTSGVGSGYFTLNFTQNTSSASRTAVITAGGKSVSITQPGQNAGCTYTINPSPLTLPHHLAYTRGFSITTNKTDCNWTVEETADWISFASSSKKSGMGSDYFTLNFTQNTSSASRTAEVKVGGKTVSITQPGQNVGCTYTINPSPLTLPHHLAYTRGFSITTNRSDCNWTVEETADWISFASSSKKSGMGSDYFTLNFTQNTSSASRTAEVKVGGKTVNITQPGKQTSAGSSSTSSSGSSSSGSAGSSSSKGCTGRACSTGKYKHQ